MALARVMETETQAVAPTPKPHPVFPGVFIVDMWHASCRIAAALVTEPSGPFGIEPAKCLFSMDTNGEPAGLHIGNIQAVYVLLSLPVYCSLD